MLLTKYCLHTDEMAASSVGKWPFTPPFWQNMAVEKIFCLDKICGLEIGLEPCLALDLSFLWQYRIFLGNLNDI